MKYCAQLVLGLASLLLSTSIPTKGQAHINVSPSLTVPSAPALQAQRRRRSLSWRVGVRPSLPRIGGFSRSINSCTDQTQITAFVPPPRSDEKIDKGYGAVDTTLSSHPTFWVHLASVPAGTQMQFTLQDEFGKKQLYNSRFESKEPTGLLGIRLPTAAPALTVGKRYVWQMAIVCDPNDRSSDRGVLGSWIQRLDPAQLKPTQGFNPKPLVQALARASKQDQPALYADLGIWQDAVTTLIDLQLKQPKNQELQADWRSLLTGAQMNEFINAPFLGVR